jgi:hypothetical protein
MLVYFSIPIFNIVFWMSFRINIRIYQSEFETSLGINLNFREIIRLGLTVVKYKFNTDYE